MTRTACKTSSPKHAPRPVTDSFFDPVTLSVSAINRMRALMAQEGPEELYLRVWVDGGGCAGLQYGFCFEGDTEPGDRVIDKNGVYVIIDPLSLPYLTGIHIDYREDCKGARFVIKNANARTTCGCGKSFSQ